MVVREVGSYLGTVHKQGAGQVRLVLLSLGKHGAVVQDGGQHVDGGYGHLAQGTLC